MKTSVDAIKDEDFNVQFLKTGSGEINDFIEVFTKMFEKLRQERVTSQEQPYFFRICYKCFDHRYDSIGL